LKPLYLFGIALVVFGACGVIWVIPAEISPEPAPSVTALKWTSWYFAIADNTLAMLLGGALILRPDTLRCCVACLCTEPFYWTFAAASVAHLRSRNMITFEDSREIYLTLGGPMARTFMLFPFEHFYCGETSSENGPNHNLVQGEGSVITNYSFGVRGRPLITDPFSCSLNRLTLGL
jgi:hypothetical protein